MTPTSTANIDRIFGHNSRCNDEDDRDFKNGDIDCPEERWPGHGDGYSGDNAGRGG